MICNRCGSPNTQEVRREAGPHYAELKCVDCGRHIKFLAAPSRPISELELPSGIPDGDALPSLIGSDKQVSFAESVRPAVVRFFARHLTPDQLAAIRTITDASWWLANRDKSVDQVRWPKAWPPKANHRGSAA